MNTTELLQSVRLHVRAQPMDKIIFVRFENQILQICRIEKENGDGREGESDEVLITLMDDTAWNLPALTLRGLHNHLDTLAEVCVPGHILILIRTLFHPTPMKVTIKQILNVDGGLLLDLEPNVP